MKQYPFLIVFTIIVAAYPAFAIDFRWHETAPVTITESVTGTAKAKTAGTILVDDKLIKLSGIRDLDADRMVCVWRKKTFDPNPNNFPPSVDSAAYKAFCDQHPRGTLRSVEHTNKCELAFTAVDQMAKLKSIVDGKTLRCKIPSDADMEQFWGIGLHKSREGQKEYPGHCYNGAKSVNAELVSTGWAAIVSDFNYRIIDPEYEKLYKIMRDDYDKIESGGSKFRSVRVRCIQDSNYRDNSDWYNN